ncbi:8-amino-7-oxononanoate synthase [Castellaniella sp.]|uniref:aminotransferase class I/II-fold pyridoxal phosphate-dependent enzyme n=1 Tax=Castellaniella sp. TaxID=1955812 RepID=UPI002AFF3005|nr:8-amino-7-oxononanoate synthase [Castellaniella sp.]
MGIFEPLYLDALRQLERQSQRRTLSACDEDLPGRRRDAAQGILNFSSNDYLGLASHPALTARACDYAQRYGAGSTASRLVCGTRTHTLAIEAKLAHAKGTEAALLFTSGWQANASVLPALLRLLGRDTQVYVDRLAHASLHQGCRAAGIREIRFRHQDLHHLEQLIQSHGGGAARRMIVTESVFSMDGDQCDMPGLTALAKRHGAFLYLDEAHATGVLGPGGMGLSGLHPDGVQLAMGTFSKALGGFGAYVAGSRALCDYLINTCSGFIHTTALPPAVLGAIDAALDLAPSLQADRDRLTHLSQRLRTALQALDIDTGASDTHIVPAIIGDEQRALDLSRHLRTQGILVTAIRPPTVPKGTSRLRIAVSAAHSTADIDTLVRAIARAQKAMA